MQINTDAEYEAAVDRVQELTGAPESTPERELIDVADAIEAWQYKAKIRQAH